MVEDLGGNTQQEDLIGDDVASDLAAAMNGGQPAQPDHNDNGQVQTHDEPAVDSKPAATLPQPVSGPSTSDKPVNHDDLHAIKHQALQQLGPLVEHIDQAPEERFDTLMMMIRASDDAALIQPAYEAAEKIEDDNKKAQALLDIVNEVNYLTRSQQTEDEPSPQTET